MNYAPPSGSMVSTTPDSCAITCCVRSAMLHGVLGRERERLVQGVRVQRLRAAEHGRERLDCGAHDVHLGLLRGQRARRRSACGSAEPRARVLRATVFTHHARPDTPRGAELRDLLEEVHVRVEEERESRREVVDVKPALATGVDVREAVGEGERELLGGGRSRLADVVAGDRDRVPCAAARASTTRSCPRRAASTARAGRCTPSARCTP